MQNKLVSVIVPSFNRAHLLERTLPSYLQGDVIELILIDDCSSDNTEEVIKNLQLKYSKIKYFRNAKNSKQPYSKNIGIEHASGEYIYFGDDDSYITDDTIRILLETSQKYDADCVGARFLYAGAYVRSDNDMQVFLNWKNKKYADDVKSICDLEEMYFNFSLNYHIPIETPAVHACALIKSEIAKSIKFDTNYLGCAYREETDFFIRVKLMGYKIMFQPLAVQINLPSYITGDSGAHAGGYKKWVESACSCNKYFLEKNWETICEKYGYTTTKERMQNNFERRLRKNNFLEQLLKIIYFKYVIVPLYKIG
jgi:glycosyltransferase involved in cell wall biosynthesis